MKGIRKLITEKALGESFAFGVSVRAWIVLMVVCTVCTMAFQGIEVKEPLYSIALFSVGFYFSRQPTSARGPGAQGDLVKSVSPQITADS